MAKKLIDRKDILNDLIENITPNYFPNNTLENSRVSIYGYITEALANSIEDTVTLEQRRAADYCPELSNSSVHVRQTAKIRGVTVSRAMPGQAFAIIGILKSDILEKGTASGNQITFTLDRRSTILHNGIPFSLEDDVIIRAVHRADGYIYAASYSGDYAGDSAYIQMFEQENDAGEEMVTMIVRIYQYAYNIQEKVVTDIVEFLYDGLKFDYTDKLAGFNVYYRSSSTDEYIKLDAIHHMSTDTTKAIYYNDDDDNILFIMNNPRLNIGANATIKVEMLETLGTAGNINLGDGNTSFSLYRDGSYNYTGIAVSIVMLSASAGATDGDALSDIKTRLIDAKSRRNNITTEHDIISYINDIDANVQIVKKRNDIQDRKYYLYTLLRYNDEIVPASTKRLLVNGIVDATHIGDFDHYDQTVDRKVIRSYSKFRLVVPQDSTKEEYIVKVDPAENTPGMFYYTCPYMILLNKYNIASYYFTSIDQSILLNGQSINTAFPFQMISRSISIYRDSHDAAKFNKYSLTITGTLNTSNDDTLVDETGAIIDPEAIVAYVIFAREGTNAAYLPMKISGYDRSTREFTFTGEMTTSDYITETNTLEITDGLFKCGTSDPYNSTIDFKDGQFSIFFMYKTADYADYPTSDTAYILLPTAKTTGYVLMSNYANDTDNLYDLVLEYNKFTSSSVTVLPHNPGEVVNFSIAEVPLIEYTYGLKNIIHMYNTFSNMATVYGSLLKLTTDFEISLKFTATYGASKYIMVTGGRDDSGNEIVVNLANLNPTFYFKVYGTNISSTDIYNFIYKYLRDTYITGTTIFISNICTQIEKSFSNVKSIKYMGVDNLDASYQEFSYNVPEFTTVDIITRFVPEQLNVTNIKIQLDEN